MTAAPFHCQTHASLERSQIMPHIRRRVGRYHQRAAMQVERSGKLTYVTFEME